MNLALALLKTPVTYKKRQTYINQYVFPKSSTDEKVLPNYFVYGIVRATHTRIGGLKLLRDLMVMSCAHLPISD